MTASNHQIIEAYETLNMAPEAIAEEFDFDLGMVKAALSQFSSKYRLAAQSNSTLRQTDIEVEEMETIILNIARYTEDEHLQFKAACRVVDERKGRLDAVKQTNGLQINVVQINAQMEKALNAVNRSKQLSTTSVSNNNTRGPAKLINTANKPDVLEATVVES